MKSSFTKRLQIGALFLAACVFIFLALDYSYQLCLEDHLSRDPWSVSASPVTRILRRILPSPAVPPTVGTSSPPKILTTESDKTTRKAELLRQDGK